MCKKIHLVFKTHLDIGFTDLSENVISEYLNQYIPKAIKTIKELENREEKLSWITGSWLIDYYLKNSSKEKVAELEAMIQKGYIGYHGLPFTTHTELMNARLFNYGLSLYKNMDAKFKRETISAKMTDVPGHTISMVPLLAASGIKFLHIGVNTGCSVPDVPPIFRWVSEDGSSVLVQYSSDYGAEYEIPNVDDLLIIKNNADNCGPPSSEQVINTYKLLKEKYPLYDIIPSNLDNYARAILPYADQFPVLDKEIGDTWIHGIASDPNKVLIYEKLLSYGEKLINEKKLIINSEIYNNYYGYLLMIPEHTWGLDCKKYLPDYSNWSIEDFKEARMKDSICLDKIPPKYQIVENFAKIEYAQIFKNHKNSRNNLTYSLFESSHKEQKEYLNSAINSLPLLLQGGLKGDKSNEAEEIDNLTVDENGIIDLGICKCQFSYQTFSSNDYNLFNNTYNRNFRDNWTWTCSDFGKPGMEFVKPIPLSKIYNPKLISYEKVGLKSIIMIKMEEGTPDSCPSLLKIICYKNKKDNSIFIKCIWNNKTASRLPEALWLSFYTDELEYKVKKLGSYIDPWNVVFNGARSLHVTEKIKGKKISIIPLTNPLVSLGKRKLLKFDNKLPEKNGEFHFNIFNNIWGTNFPQWYEGEGQSEFIIKYNNK
ncbi:MAG: DUF5054 domain-containing protein [Spirochaetaceae bacterium]|nr:DUF5054 domain-containing protein [Spirochaetaceae bacterium]